MAAQEARTVLVTGANRGLGLEFVRQYADAGWNVRAACRAPKSAKELKAVQARHPDAVTEAFVENVAKGRDRRIVTLTSLMGSIADNASGGSYAYRSSKAGVNAVMKSISIDLASRGITCVVVHPGWVRTDMGGAGGKLAPAESVKALRAVSGSLTRGDSGKFFNYDGRELPW